LPDTADRLDPVQELLGRVSQVARDSQGLLRELVGSERRFRALAKAVWQVQEEERRRLARDLHDGLGQELTALKNQLELLSREAGGAGAGGLGAKLASAVELAARALQDTRELSRLLRPPILDDLGLGPALSWLARTLRESAGLEVRVAGDGVEGRLDPDLEILVFRVAQEALTNVLKHSQARAAAVQLHRRGGWLELEITDAGRGFDAAGALDPARGTPGSGLRGMRDRLELFGGRLRITSAPGAGTRVHAAVPLPQPVPAAPAPATAPATPATPAT
jgi:two-component system, NarL family, sensor kinase